ncbi:MAG: DUF4416 family protein [bacterium]
MGQLKEPFPIKFLAAVTYKNDTLLKETKKALEFQYGRIDHESPPFAFDHTQYYEHEMGPDLMKQLFSFQVLYKIEELIEFKLFSLQLEKRFSKGDRRQVNIDPGYLELSKLVISSTKNFDHRIYLGRGVFGDVQLRYRKGQFVTNEWTYPDYCSQIVLNFLLEVRAIYIEKLKQLSNDKSDL